MPEAKLPDNVLRNTAPTLPVVIDLSNPTSSNEPAEVPSAWGDAFEKIELINSKLATQRLNDRVDSAATSLYQRMDALAVSQLQGVRQIRKSLYWGSAVLCTALAIGALLLKIPPVLMLLPTVVFVLLKINGHHRKGKSWQAAVYARAFAELLRIRSAVSFLGYATSDIANRYPSQERLRFLPVMLGILGVDAVERHIDPKQQSSNDAPFVAWVDEQANYYKSAQKRENHTAKSGVETFDRAFTLLAVIAIFAILYSIFWPQGGLGLLASCVGAWLSSLGLIAINYARETGAGTNARDYGHMMSVFSKVRDLYVRDHRIAPEIGLDLVEEVLAEHAGWFSRTSGS